jgi:hypothetical protein
MSFKPKVYKREDLEWCSGRMAHLRLKGGVRHPTICGADVRGYGSVGRVTLTNVQAADMHQCKKCFKRVEPEWMCADGDIFPTREAAVQHLRMLADDHGRSGRLCRLPFAGTWEMVDLHD